MGARAKITILKGQNSRSFINFLKNIAKSVPLVAFFQFDKIIENGTPAMKFVFEICKNRESHTLAMPKQSTIKTSKTVDLNFDTPDNTFSTFHSFKVDGLPPRPHV